MMNGEHIILFEFAEEEFSGQIREALGELFPFFERKNLIRYNPKSGRLALDYCGFAASGRKLVTVLPKYLRKTIGELPDSDLKTKMCHKEAGKLYRLLKRNEYGSRSNNNVEVHSADFMNENSAGYTNEIALAEFILSDYQDNGLWFYNSRKVLMNAGGETDWDMTVNNTDAVISNGQPCYFDTYSTANELITDSLITRIHKFAVNYCNGRYGFLLDMEMAELPETADYSDDLGDNYSLLYALEKQLRISYRERDILLLKSLAELIQIDSSRSDERLSLYGRRDFEQVWESALQYCLGHQDDLRGHLMPVPEWYNSLTARFLDLNVNDTLKPDIIRTISSGEHKYIFVFDAKYYMLNYDIRSTFPPVGDIIKQYFYEAAVSRKGNGYTAEYVINAFIFPSLENDGHQLIPSGHVKLDNDLFMVIAESGNIKKPIITFHAAPDYIFGRYTRRIPFSDDEIIGILNSYLTYINQQ